MCGIIKPFHQRSEMAAGVGYMVSFLGYGMTALRYFRVQIPLFASVVGISALVCFFLVPVSGLKGAALALVSSQSSRCCSPWPSSATGYNDPP